MQILSSFRPRSDKEDEIVWRKDNCGFTVKSCYSRLSIIVAYGNCIGAETLKGLDLIWKLKISSRYQIFSWRLLLARLPMKLELAKRGILSGNHELVCPHCWKADESLEHVFLNCPTSRHVWLQMSAWMRLDIREKHNSLVSHICYFTYVSNRSSYFSCLFFITIFWSLGTSKNKTLFHIEMLKAQKIFELSKYLAWEWWSTRNEGRFSYRLT